MIRARLELAVLAAFAAASVFILGSTVIRASGKVVEFTADVSPVIPCSPYDAVSGTLNVHLVANRQTTAGGTHVNVHANVEGQLNGADGSAYQVAGEGSEQFDTVANHYDLTFHAEVVGHGDAANLTLEGVARMFVNGAGDPVGGTLLSATPSCK